MIEILDGTDDIYNVSAEQMIQLGSKIKFRYESNEKND